MDVSLLSMLNSTLLVIHVHVMTFALFTHSKLIWISSALHIALDLDYYYS